MIDYHNPYVRLQAYYACLTGDADLNWDSDDTGISIAQLNEITKIPKKVIYQDIILLSQWQNFVFFDFEQADTDKDASLPRLKELCEQITETCFPKELKSYLFEGELDDIPLCPGFAQASYQLGLTSDEAAALQYVYEQKTQASAPVSEKTSGMNSQTKMHGLYGNVKNRFQSEYLVKDSFRYCQYRGCSPRIDGKWSAVNDLLDTLNLAIEHNKCLELQYKPPGGKLLSAAIKPLKIAYDSTENQYAVLTIKQGRVEIYFLEYIKSVSTHCSRKIKISDLSLLDRAPKVWGLDFNASPVHVKVRFYNEGNVWKKIRRDLSYRNGSLYEESGYLYYEDVVYGIEHFKTWLYGYGSSAIVLEPENLRQQIIGSLKRRRERF